ncbi:MAG: hypothetical protein M3Y85_02155, partial [Bacteroidota bacterium]|nr:hypothetical protein [Bacteroidota bacterium]
MIALSTILIICTTTTITVAGIYFLLIRRKIKMLTAGFNHEFQNLRHEINMKANRIELSLYEQIAGEERIIYNGETNNENFFTGKGSRTWDYVAHTFSEGEGQGSYKVKDGEITIERTNTAGRYELYLRSYQYNGMVEKIPAGNPVGVRRLRLSCEVKKGKASHMLRFVFKGDSQNVLDEKDYVIFSPDWERITVVFTITAVEACVLRIDDLNVLQAPSTI